MSTILHQTLSHPSLHPSNLGILPRKKSWLLNLDIVVLADSGNVYDALFMAARAALWDTKVPRTRSVEYRARKGAAKGDKAGGSGDMDLDEDTPSGFDTRHITNATDFELPDYWDEGEVLEGRDKWPVCITLNAVRRVTDQTPGTKRSCSTNRNPRSIILMQPHRKKHRRRSGYFLCFLSHHRRLHTYKPCV
jgi:exosome complex component RRP42